MIMSNGENMSVKQTSAPTFLATVKIIAKKTTHAPEKNNGKR